MNDQAIADLNKKCSSLAISQSDQQHIDDTNYTNLNSKIKELATTFKTMANELSETDKSLRKTIETLSDMNNKRRKLSKYQNRIVQEYSEYNIANYPTSNDDYDEFCEIRQKEEDDHYKGLHRLTMRINATEAAHEILITELYDLRRVAKIMLAHLLKKILDYCTDPKENGKCVDRYYNSSLSTIFEIYSCSLLNVVFKSEAVELTGPLLNYRNDYDDNGEIVHSGKKNDKGIDITMYEGEKNDAGVYGVVQCKKGGFFSRGEGNSIILQLGGSMLCSDCTRGIIMSSESNSKLTSNNKDLLTNYQKKNYLITCLFIEEIRQLLNSVIENDLSLSMLKYFVNCLKNSDALEHLNKIIEPSSKIFDQLEQSFDQVSEMYDYSSRFI